MEELNRQNKKYIIQCKSDYYYTKHSLNYFLKELDKLIEKNNIKIKEEDKLIINDHHNCSVYTFIRVLEKYLIRINFEQFVHPDPEIQKDLLGWDYKCLLEKDKFPDIYEKYHNDKFPILDGEFSELHVYAEPSEENYFIGGYEALYPSWHYEYDNGEYRDFIEKEDDKKYKEEMISEKYRKKGLIYFETKELVDEFFESGEVDSRTWFMELGSENKNEAMKYFEERFDKHLEEEYQRELDKYNITDNDDCMKSYIIYDEADIDYYFENRDLFSFPFFITRYNELFEHFYKKLMKDREEVNNSINDDIKEKCDRLLYDYILGYSTKHKFAPNKALYVLKEYIKENYKDNYKDNYKEYIDLALRYIMNYTRHLDRDKLIERYFKGDKRFLYKL
ncbi:hypothetical protein [Brachyspira sp.]|uniref:hypothetical protein n=1 Tax=Brachyspira sp. TaxID=1977261 RepID=UPI002602326A|nr:hypothetical protein [Brachyspira sp.]